MTITVIDDSSAQRFEVFDGDQRAGYLAYRVNDGVLDLTSTQVDPQFGGRGLAAQLVGFALNTAREQGLLVRPTCSYVANYLQKHSDEYGDLATE